MLLSETSNAFKKTTQHKVLHRATWTTLATTIQIAYRSEHF